MSENTQKQEQPQQSDGPAAPPRTPAPAQPDPGTMTASPLTGSGPHRAQEKTPAQQREEAEAQQDQAHAQGQADPEDKPKERPRMPPQLARGLAQKRQAEQQQAATQMAQSAYQCQPAQQPNFHDPAVASLLTKTLNNERSQAQKFYMVVLPEDDWPRTESFERVDDLLTAIKDLVGKNCHVFPFLGHKLAITEGPNRFLSTPYGPLPLFDIPEPDEVEEAEHGWLGANLHPPSIPKEEFPDEEEDDIHEPDQPGTPSAEEASSEEQPEQQPRTIEESGPDDTPVFES